MAMVFMKNVVGDAQAAKTSILKIMSQNIGGMQKARSHKTVHASDVTKTDFCPKQFALLDIYDLKKKDEYINTALQATFDIGNSTAQVFTDKWAGDSIIGNWSCAACGKIVSFKEKPKDGCPTMKRCDWKYEEVNFVSPEYEISGSIDAILDLLAPKLFITELKIIKAEDFNDIVAPLAEHRIRTSMYMKIIEESDSVYRTRLNVQEARVFYISRGYGKKNLTSGEIVPFKEFIVKRDDTAVMPYLNKAKEVKLFRHKGVIPQGVCKTALDAKAKKCAACVQCFSGAHPVGSIYTETP